MFTNFWNRQEITMTQEVLSERTGSARPPNLSIKGKGKGGKSSSKAGETQASTKSKWRQLSADQRRSLQSEEVMVRLSWIQQPMADLPRRTRRRCKSPPARRNWRRSLETSLQSFKLPWRQRCAAQSSTPWCSPSYLRCFLNHSNYRYTIKSSMFTNLAFTNWSITKGSYGGSAVIAKSSPETIDFPVKRRGLSGVKNFPPLHWSFGPFFGSPKPKKLENPSPKAMILGPAEPSWPGLTFGRQHGMPGQHGATLWGVTARSKGFVSMGLFIDGGTPIAGCFIRENPNLNWMI